MKQQSLLFYLVSLTICLTVGALQSAGAAVHPLARTGTHFCGVTGDQWNKRYSDQYPNRRYARRAMANLNTGEPRTVRMIYFLPNDRPYRAEMVQKMKDEILNIQTFFAEQMEAHGYGRTTFRIETDPKGEPKVHRVDGQQPNSDYQKGNDGDWLSDIEQAGFDITANVYLIAMDLINDEGGFGGRWGKNGGEARLLGNVWFTVAAHELGHAFGLQHDFHDGAYIMSYGPGQTRLSACHAEFLSVHPYFNPNISTREDDPPTIELISSTRYTAGTKRVPVRLKISGSARLHQAILFATTVPTTGRHSATAGFLEVKACHGLVGNRDTVVEFDYDGVIPVDRSTSLSNPVVHPMDVNVVDTNGNVGWTHFVLFSEALEPLTKISGNNLQGLPNTPLPVPFVVEVRDLSDGWRRRGVPVKFTVTAGGGKLSVERVKTDKTGRAESTLTLGPNFGRNTVEVSAEGFTVTFTAIAGTPVEIPDKKLRMAVETELEKAQGQPIAPSDMASLTQLDAREEAISNLTGLAHATNLTRLELVGNKISDVSVLANLTNLESLFLDGNPTSDISPLVGLTNLTRLGLGGTKISNISPLADLTDLTWLRLGGNNISDISPLTDLTDLTWLYLEDNYISDLSPLAGLTNLRHLVLYINKISDPSPVAGLTDLTHLNLAENSISDISALANLTNLTSLELPFNSISDLSALVVNTELGAGDEVDVRGNPLNRASIETHIPALQGRGVTVEFDNIITELVNIPDPNLRAAIETELGKATGDTITTYDMANLTRFEAEEAGIHDLTGLEHATKLTRLSLDDNAITNISVLAGLTNLTDLSLARNNITDISVLAGLPNLINLALGYNAIRDHSILSGLTNLTELDLRSTNISDLSVLSGLTKLERLYIDRNGISDLSPLAALTNLTTLALTGNSISNLSPLRGLTNLAWMRLAENDISDLSPLAGLTNLTYLNLAENSISDLSPLVKNTGLGDGDEVYVDGNPLSYTSINTHIPTLRSRGVVVHANNLKPTTLEYLLSVPAGINLIHVPLKVSAVDGVAKTIESISDLYDALGGTDAVNVLITYEPSTQEWLSYFGVSDKGTATDKTLDDQMGIIAGMKAPTSVRLIGKPLGNNGRSFINLNQGLNIVGLPLRDSRINRVSNLLSLDGIQGNVPVVLVTVNGDFKSVGRAGDPADVPITGGQGFILTAQRATTVTLSGEGWTNSSATAAPLMARTGLPVTNTTPVLALKGSIVDEVSAVNRVGFRVAVKNLSTGRQVATTAADAEAGYRLAVVDIETARAAQVGDTLDISAQSFNPFIGVQPLRYTLTVEDVKQSLIRLPALVAYEIPTETELLANYPNPFNPETWIPYRLAEDTFVTLTIYDSKGQGVRTLDVGHRIAAVYEDRSKAIYWDGRSDFGQPVVSGVYFYHLNAGDYSQTRKMIILK